MTTHKATPEQWALLEEQSAPEYDSTILELRARMEVLEAASPGCPHIATSTEGTSYCRLAEQMANSQPTPNPSQIRSSLVERVSCAIDGRINPDQWLHQDAARAVIREVAAWMTSNPDVYFPPALVFALEQEAER